jgi:hypothetical protein
MDALVWVITLTKFRVCRNIQTTSAQTRRTKVDILEIPHGLPLWPTNQLSHNDQSFTVTEKHNLRHQFQHYIVHGNSGISVTEVKYLG